MVLCQVFCIQTILYILAPSFVVQEKGEKEICIDSKKEQRRSRSKADVESKSSLISKALAPSLSTLSNIKKNLKKSKKVKEIFESTTCRENDEDIEGTI